MIEEILFVVLLTSLFVAVRQHRRAELLERKLDLYRRAEIEDRVEKMKSGEAIRGLRI